MTVKELIGELSECNPDALVVMSIDGEGNAFKPVDSGLCHGIYEDREVRFYLDAEGEEDIPDDECNAVVIWPT